MICWSHLWKPEPETTSLAIKMSSALSTLPGGRDLNSCVVHRLRFTYRKLWGIPLFQIPQRLRPNLLNKGRASNNDAASGKRVDWIEHLYEEGDLLVGIRFKDKTYFSLIFTPCIEARLIELSDVASGDDVILKQYYRRREG